MEFAARQHGSAIKRVLGLEATPPHWEAAQGSAQQNIAYCTKEETRVEGGWTFRQGEPLYEEPLPENRLVLASGAMNDEALAVAYNEGASPDELMTLMGNSAWRPGQLNAVQQLCNRRPLARRSRVLTYYIWGETGVGKTFTAQQRAIALAGPDSYFIHSSGMGKWFDGYNPLLHSVIIFDDAAKPQNNMSSGQLTIIDWLDICQPKQQTLQVKGGSVQANWVLVIITSNFSLDVWLSDVTAEAHKKALKSRIGSRVEHLVGRDRRREHDTEFPTRLDLLRPEHMDLLRGRSAQEAVVVDEESTADPLPRSDSSVIIVSQEAPLPHHEQQQHHMMQFDASMPTEGTMEVDEALQNARINPLLDQLANMNFDFDGDI